MIIFPMYLNQSKRNTQRFIINKWRNKAESRLTANSKQATKAKISSILLSPFSILLGLGCELKAQLKREEGVEKMFPDSDLIFNGHSDWVNHFLFKVYLGIIARLGNTARKQDKRQINVQKKLLFVPLLLSTDRVTIMQVQSSDSSAFLLSCLSGHSRHVKIQVSSSQKISRVP